MKRTALLLGTLALLGTSCGATVGSSSPTTTSAVGPNDELGSLASARERWAESAPADYTLVQLDRLDASPDQPSTLAVHDGEEVSLAGETKTVDEVFGAIEKSIRDGDDVIVDYHPDLGYPTRVILDRDRDGVPDVHLEHRDIAAMPIVRTAHDLRAAQRRWEAQDIDSYRYIFRFDCTCPEGGTFEIDVRDGRVVDRRPLDDAARNSSLDPGVDIDATFDDLEEWFVGSADLLEQGILEVDVRIDPQLGYPRWLRIEGEGLDDEFFRGRFSMVVTIDLIGELEPVEPTADLDDLQQVEEAHALWQEAALADYSYTLQVHCMCTPETSGPFQVNVSGGEVASIVLLSEGTETDADVITIDDAFEMIGLAVVGGTDVDVVYNTEFGFPESVVIDPEAVAVDGGLAFSISGLEVLGQS